MVDEDRRLCERLEYYGWDLGPGAGSGRESGCSEKEKKKVSRLLQTRPLVTGNYVHIVNVFFEHIEIRLLISTQSKSTRRLKVRRVHAKNVHYEASVGPLYVVYTLEAACVRCAGVLNWPPPLYALEECWWA